MSNSNNLSLKIAEKVLLNEFEWEFKFAFKLHNNSCFVVGRMHFMKMPLHTSLNNTVNSYDCSIVHTIKKNDRI